MFQINQFFNFPIYSIFQFFSIWLVFRYFPCPMKMLENASHTVLSLVQVLVENMLSSGSSENKYCDPRDFVSPQVALL